MSGDIDVMSETQMVGARYRPGKLQVGTGSTRKPIQRASLTADQPVVRKTVDYAEPNTRAPRPPQPQQRRTADYQQPRSFSDADTNADVEVAPNTRGRSDRPAPPTRQLPPLRRRRHGAARHWLVYIGIGMIVGLVLWVIGVQVRVGWTNNVSDPSYYTQTAHLDMVTTVTDAQGHQSQVRAFLDVQGRLDLLVLPIGSDVSKAHVVVGPTPITVTDLRHATITVTAHGTVLTVTVQGPLEANYLSTTRQSSSWTIDLKKTGGH